MPDLTAESALGWLAVGLINRYPHPDDWAKRADPDDPMQACCVINCGECAALKWFGDNERSGLEDLIRLTGYEKGGWAFWDEAADSLRWDWFEAYWASHSSCGMIAGIPTGCRLGDDEDEPAEVKP